LGSAVFWMRIAVAEPDTSAQTVHITSAIREEVRRELEVGLGRKAAPDEYQAALEHWKLDEVAFREALRMGLNDQDPVIRRQLVSKYFEVNLRLQPLPEPTRAELDAWLAAHRDDYVPKPRYDFEHVFVQGTDDQALRRARDIAAAVERGEDPGTLGDRFHFGRTFLGRSRGSIEVEFDERFAKALVELEPGHWAVLRSKHGWHVARVDRRSGGRLPPRAELERVLYRDFREQARQRLFRQQLESLESSYRFVEQAP
jgi:parvulin-like peptidyl-prolyl isomerase